MVIKSSGPTGHLLPEEAQAVPTAWSFHALPTFAAGVDSLNEQEVHRWRTRLCSTQASVCLLVDDTLMFSRMSCSLSPSGMKPERMPPNEVLKVIGLAYSSNSNTFSLHARM